MLCDEVGEDIVVHISIEVTHENGGKAFPLPFIDKRGQILQETISWVWVQGPVPSLGMVLLHIRSVRPNF